MDVQATRNSTPLRRHVGPRPGAIPVVTSSKGDILELGKGATVPPSAQSSISRAASAHVASPMRAGNQIDLFVEGKEAYPQMEKLIAGATQRIDMEFFLVHNGDEASRRIADQLIAKVKSGVQVNLLVDRISNRSNGLLDELEQAGVNVKRFTNGYEWPLLNANSITDHRKILLVDGKVGMTGGMNIGDRYAKYWHDLMIKVEGPTVGDMYQKFDANWKMSGGQAPRKVALQTAFKGSDVAQVAETAKGKTEIKKSMVAAFDQAQDRILINSPYMLDDEVIGSLKRAAGRGVKVTALIPASTDFKTVDRMHLSVINELLDSGVDLRLYDTSNPSVAKRSLVTDHFNHGKVATVDGVWTTFGTANADARSMAMSQEINLNIESKSFAATVEERIFQHDLLTNARKAEHVEFSAAEKPLQWVLKSIRHLF